MDARLNPFVRVRVKTDATREMFAENAKGGFDISVRELAEGNQANTRVLELVAIHLDVPPKAVHIVTGHHRSSKLLRISGSSGR